MCACVRASVCVCVHMFLFFFHSLLADCVFGPGKETKELFDVLGKPILDKVINGVNGEGVCVCICATMFVYVCMCVCMHHWQQWSGHSYSNSCVYIDTKHVVLACVVLVLYLKVYHTQTAFVTWHATFYCCLQIDK